MSRIELLGKAKALQVLQPAREQRAPAKAAKVLGRPREIHHAGLPLERVLPSHGRPIDDPVPALRALATNLAELYDLRKDPGENVNLVADSGSAPTLAALTAELARLMAATGLSVATDRMPIDAGIKKELPNQNIR